MEKKPSTSDQLKYDFISSVLQSASVSAAEYRPQTDHLVIYDSMLHITNDYPDFLTCLSHGDSCVFSEDIHRVREFLKRTIEGPVEFRMICNDEVCTKLTGTIKLFHNSDGDESYVFSMIDITQEKEATEILTERAKRDPLTGLYNQLFGRELITEYLTHRGPYSSCGMLILDIDYFKNVNDNYGHLFGDQVLISLAGFLQRMVYDTDIVMRAGGDEFVIFFKEISHSSLVNKVMTIINSVRSLRFSEQDYSITCSAGVCFLPENVSGFTYEQLFSNADWALYKAKENGRNRYVFCDNLNRFESNMKEDDTQYSDIDTRYLHNDIISTAFEIFEKTNNFDTALNLLLKIIGIRFNLNRITIIQTDIKNKVTNRQYQWLSDNAVPALNTPGSFSKEDFLTLFQSYDENGTTVIHYNHLDMYSEDARRLLMQGNAKTVVYAAMYCAGSYTGAISYVDSECKRYWSKDERNRLGELTKIISAHLSQDRNLNVRGGGIMALPDYDALTGLLAFSKFRDEVERIIVSGQGKQHVLIYSDIVDFKHFNKHYGYANGDILLKEFSAYIMEELNESTHSYFTRAISDQFIIFCNYHIDNRDLEAHIAKINALFSHNMKEKFPDASIQIRSGIYIIPNDCISAAAAIDAADYARKHTDISAGITVKLYDQNIQNKQLLQDELIHGFEKALREKQFKIYLQPRISLKDQSVIGAEAYVRWVRDDGTILTPASFLHLFEENGRISEIDFYVCDQVAAFLEKGIQLKRKPIPISVNASIFHARDDGTVEHYLRILKDHNVPPSLLEVELTENAMISYYNNVKQLFEDLHEENILTSLDDFGAGYIRLNSLIDLPVNTVKLDSIFLNFCMNHDNGKYLLKQIISIVKELGYHVVCEGVETREQLDILLAAGCEEAQGNYFSRPVTIEEFEKNLYS